MALSKIEPVVAQVNLPPGMLGPDPVSFEVRAFVVSGPRGIVLVDTGTPGSSEAIGAALDRLGAGWRDVTDIVFTHRHFDHVGGLAELKDAASSARLWAGAEDAPAIQSDDARAIRSLGEGDRVGDLQVFDTPGHTAGHISLLHEDASVLFVGDLVGSMGGELNLGPPAFTADPERSRQSLRRMVELASDRILFSHGDEVADAVAGIRELLDVTPS